MRILKHLLDNNRAWAQKMKAQRPDFFERLSKQQAPEYMWIGCSDSRLPPNDITGLLPGELFVHRNVGNVVVHTDFNCLSVMEYAVAELRVKHIIVCGHYGCGGVNAALKNLELGLIDNWLRHIRDVYFKHEARLTMMEDESKRWDKLCELNVVEQVYNVCNTTIVQSAWKRGQELAVHGWIYRLIDGLLHDLGICIIKPEEVLPMYDEAIEGLFILKE
ncbi:MAG TPA: carbonate dehydratase [Thermodesulfobacteriota bacterium]|jgi:carbonic anhydrase|nr:carbonate dehydratase [Thermodesulfobacteriota bacterium]